MEKLINLLEQQIESKEKEKYDIEQQNKNLTLISKIKDDFNSLASTDIMSIINYFGIELDSSQIQNLQIYKMFLESNLTNGTKFVLTEEQQLDLLDIIYDIEKNIEISLKQSNKINKNKEKEISSLKLTMKRLADDNFDYIKSKDLINLETVLPNLTHLEQLDVLKKIIILNGKKVNKNIEKKDIEPEDFSITNISYPEVKEIFDKYNLTIENDKILEERILKYGDLEKIDSILDFLNSKDLLTKIDYQETYKKQFLDMLAFSNLEIVKKRYDFSKERNIRFESLLKGVSSFIPNNKRLANRGVYSRRRSTNGNSHYNNNDNRCGTADSFDENIIILESLGFNINEVFRNCSGWLNNRNLKDAINTLLIYNFKMDEDFSLSSIATATKRVDEIIDRYIELGLFGYIKQFPSGLNNYTEDRFEKIYYTNHNNYSPLNNNNTINKNTIDTYGKPSNDDMLIIDIDQKYEEENMPIRQLYFLANKSSYDDFELALNDEKIQELEKNKVDEYIYSIEGIKVSRYKVLRIYSEILKDGSIDKDKGLLFSVTYKSMLNEGEYNDIKQSIKEKVI
ncbi:MAG: hypothetical protein ACI4OT_03055 [Bacilli bacterium]